MGGCEDEGLRELGHEWDDGKRDGDLLCDVTGDKNISRLGGKNDALGDSRV